MPEFINPDGDTESRTNDYDLRWKRIDGIVQYGAVPENTPRAIAVGVDGDALERDLSVDGDGVASALEVNPILRSLVEENNIFARAMVLGLTAMTEVDLLAEASD
ncbi:hypothetical protein LCGC14_0391450 [marine sediment metagenome]|uniref:Uncharacterized protein n=1 Tax=marine sediment metagenome TaxID=412755 RepID=A0A0F9T5A9_9ZZZZ